MILLEKNVNAEREKRLINLYAKNIDELKEINQVLITEFDSIYETIICDKCQKSPIKGFR